MRRNSEIVLTSSLHASNAALHLNGRRMYVPESPLEGIIFENRGGARLLEKHVARLSRRVYLVCGGLSKHDPCRKTDTAGGLALVPGLLK